MSPKDIHVQQPAQGKVAICSRKEVGLILSKAPVQVTYPDKSTGLAWTGIHLSAEKFGEPWCARNPIVLNGVSNMAAELLARVARVSNMAAELLARVAHLNHLRARNTKS